MNLKKKKNWKHWWLWLKVLTSKVLTHCEGTRQSECFYNVVRDGTHPQQSKYQYCQIWVQDRTFCSNWKQWKSLFVWCWGQTLSKSQKCNKGVKSRKVMYLFWEDLVQGQKLILIRVQEMKDVSPQCKSVSVFISFCFLIFVPSLKALHCWLCPILSKTLIRNISTLVQFNFQCPELAVVCKHLNWALYFLAIFLFLAFLFFFFFLFFVLTSV